VGKEDPLTPPAGASRIAAAGRIAAAIPGAKMVEIPGAARLPNLEQPAAFNQAVLSFLQGL